MKKLIVITGPTASGKTGLAVELAKRLSADVLSADSRQFFKEMSIGTAKPTVQEMDDVAHHFVGHISIHESYTVGQYERDVMNLLNRYFKENDHAILVGGSGLYIKAICEGLDDFPEIEEEKRTFVRESYETMGLNWLQDQIKEKDPVYYRQVDIQNPQRLMRALEVIESSGKPFSSFLHIDKTPREFEILKFAIQWDRATLYNRINLRVDQMLEAGLLNEVQSLVSFKHLNALQTVGYTELFDYFDDRYDIAEAVRLIKRNTRRYAKRQLTWFRRELDMNWISSDLSRSRMIDEILRSLIK